MNDTFNIVAPLTGDITIPNIETPVEINKRALPLVDETDPIIREVMPDWDWTKPPTDSIQLAYDLTETMRKYDGLGLSANQIGFKYRVFVLNTYPQIFVCFNPKIVNVSKETILLEEGCLSYPNLFIKIRRPRTIKARFTLPNGETRTDTFDGMTARVYQHELDHLNGVVFYSRASMLDRRQAMTRRKQMNRKNG